MTCPECGNRCNVAALVMRAWTGPWQAAPGYSRLLGPLAWVLSLGLAVLVVATLESAARLGATPVGALVLASTGLAVWAWWLSRLGGFLPRRRAVRLSLLAHALAAGYIAGTVGPLVLVGRAITSGSLVTSAFLTVPAAAALPLVVLCRRGERYIAGRCIAHYLARVTEDRAPGGAAAGPGDTIPA